MSTETPILSQGHDIARSAAIVCTHVANDGLPILVARRDESVDPVDTGWQFHCDVHDHGGENDAIVVAVEEVVALDPTVLPLLDNLHKTAFRRDAADAPWTPEPYEVE